MSPSLPIDLDRSSGQPLYRQIERWIRHAIDGGRLPPGTRLPGVRTLARDLGVSVVPVITAYELLGADGYLVSQVGLGTTVAPDPPRPIPRTTVPGEPPAQTPGSVRCGSAGFMKAVARDLRDLYGDHAKIVFCAERGSGFAQASEAATDVCGTICTPPFAEADVGSDFNDFCHGYGMEATRDALAETTQPGSLPSVETSSAVRSLVEDINRSYFVADRYGNETTICREDGKKFFPVTERSFRLAVARRTPGIKGSPSHIWLTHPQRRQVGRVAYDPEWKQLGINDRNIWTGFTVEPSPGSCERFDALLLDGIAGGDKRVATYIKKWMATIVQHPGRPCGVALVLTGAEGTGKGTLFKPLLRLFGPHGMQLHRTDRTCGSVQRTSGGQNLRFLRRNGLGERPRPT